MVLVKSRTLKPEHLVGSSTANVIKPSRRQEAVHFPLHNIIQVQEVTPKSQWDATNHLLFVPLNGDDIVLAALCVVSLGTSKIQVVACLSFSEDIPICRIFDSEEHPRLFAWLFRNESRGHEVTWAEIEVDVPEILGFSDKVEVFVDEIGFSISVSVSKRVVASGLADGIYVLNFGFKMLAQMHRESVQEDSGRSMVDGSLDSEETGSHQYAPASSPSVQLSPSGTRTGESNSDTPPSGLSDSSPGGTRTPGSEGDSIQVQTDSPDAGMNRNRRRGDVRLPGMSIIDGNIRMPWVSIIDGNIRMPGLSIIDGNIRMGGMRIGKGFMQTEGGDNPAADENGDVATEGKCCVM